MLKRKGILMLNYKLEIRELSSVFRQARDQVERGHLLSSHRGSLLRPSTQCHKGKQINPLYLHGLDK